VVESAIDACHGFDCAIRFNWAQTVCADRKSWRCKQAKKGEVMNKALVAIVTGLSLATLCTAAGAQQLPKSGSINWHTGW